MLFEKLPWPSMRDAEPLADRAVRAVGGDQVAGAHGPLGAAVARPDDGRHAVVVLLDETTSVRVLEPSTPSSSAARGEDRLEPDLGDEEPRRRAEVLDALVDVAEVPVELLAAEALDRHDRAVLDELARGGLDRSRPRARRARYISIVRWLKSAARGWIAVPRMALDDERRTPWCAEEERRRQPDEAAADDQNGNLVVRHSRSSLTDRPSARSKCSLSVKRRALRIRR